VVDRAPSGDEERALRELHEEIPGWPGYWARNLEGSYAPREDLETLAALGRPWLFVDRGTREMEWSSHCNVEEVRWVLANRPHALVGPDPRELCCEVPAPVLKAAMRPKIQNLLDDVRSWAPFDIIWTQRYVVETACRMLYTLEHGEVITKPGALDWAAEALPAEWRDLVRQVRADRLVQWDAPPPPGAIERAVAFVEYVQARELSSRP
jgi:aminoglycoside adenylyltransferase-like protein